MTNRKLFIYAILCVISVTPFVFSDAHAFLKEEKEAKPAIKNHPILEAQEIKAVPNRIIIKLKSQEKESTLKRSNRSRRVTSSSKIKLSKEEKHLKALNSSFKLKQKKRLFKNRSKSKQAVSKTIQKKNSNVSPLSAQAPQTSIEDRFANIEIYDFEPTVGVTFDAQAACMEYRKNPLVEYCQPDYIYEALDTPDDEYFSSSGSWGQQDFMDLWGIHITNTDEAWDIQKGEDVIVAVVDTGVDYTHPDLIGNMWTNPNEALGDKNGDGCPGICGVDDDGDGEIDEGDVNDDDENGYDDDIHGWDFAEQDKRKSHDDVDPDDVVGHGTHVAGTIAAVGNNGMGIIGVAPSAKIMAAKGLNDFGWGSDSHLSEAIVYAVDNGAKVINNSWGCSICPHSDLTEDAVRYANENGVVIIFSAGNSNINTTWSNPVNQKEPIVVAASTHLDEKTYFSSWGPSLSVAAPGGGYKDEESAIFAPHRNILSLFSGLADSEFYGDLVVNEGYMRNAGTSMAAPHVSGLAALIVAQHPDYTPEQVSMVIKASADDIGRQDFDNEFGHGRMNSLKALTFGQPLDKVEITYPPLYAEKFFTSDLQVQIRGSVLGENLSHFELFYAPFVEGHLKDEVREIGEWIKIVGPISNTQIEDDILGTLDLSELENSGRYYLKLVAHDINGQRYEDISVLDYWGDFDVFDEDPDMKLVFQGEENKIFYVRHFSFVPRYFNESEQFFLYDIKTNTHQHLFEDELGLFFPNIAVDSNSKIDISGDKLYWIRYNEDVPSFEPIETDIHTLEHTKLNIFPIESDEYEEFVETISAWRNYVVWSGQNSVEDPSDSEKTINKYSVVLYDRDTQTYQNIEQEEYYYKIAPVIQDGKVVWINSYTQIVDDTRKRFYDIMLHNIFTNETKKISTTQEAFKAKAKISGNSVYWIEQVYSEEADWNTTVIAHYDMETEETTYITTDLEVVNDFDVNHNLLVWKRLYRMHLMNLDTEEVTLIPGTVVDRKLDLHLFEDTFMFSEVGINETFATDTYITDTDFTSPAILISPALGTQLQLPSLHLSWTEGVGATRYWVRIGTSPGDGDLFNRDMGQSLESDIILSQTEGMIYIRLWSLINGQWEHRDYEYMAVDGGELPDFANIQMPEPGSTIDPSNVTFTWSSGASNVTKYWLYIGSTPGAKDLVDKDMGLNLQDTLSFDTGDLTVVYATLWSEIDGEWIVTDKAEYSIDAPAPDETVIAEIQTPQPGATINPAEVIFTWSEGVEVDEYWLYVGTRPGRKDLINQSYGTDLGATVSFSVPDDLERVYAIIWSRIGETWHAAEGVDGAVEAVEYLISQEGINQDPEFNPAIGNREVQVGNVLQFTISASDPDVGDVLSYSTVGELPDGAEFNEGTQEFHWMPTEGQVGEHSVTFRVDDDKGGFDEETITITVTEVDRIELNLSIPPDGDGNYKVDVDEGEVLTFDINISTNDDSTIHFNITGLREWMDVQRISSTSHLFVGRPVFNDAGTYNVTFTVSNDSGVEDSKTVMISVNDVNQTPILNSIGDRTVEANNELSFRVRAEDPDNDPVVFSATSLPDGATLDSVSGEFSWTPDETQVGDHSITFRVDDEKENGVDEETITITVLEEEVLELASLLSPVPDTIIDPSGITFTWSAGSSHVIQYWLYVGTTPGAKDLVNQDAGTSLELTTSFETTNNVVYAQMWSNVNGDWQARDPIAYQIEQVQQGGSDIAQLLTPAPDLTLDSSPVTFTWSAGTNVSEYWLYVGTQPGSKDIVNESMEQSLEAMVNIPLNGDPIYVQIWSLRNGEWYAEPSIEYETTSVMAQIILPEEGATIDPSSVDFKWSETAGATEYWLYVGTSPGAKDLINQSYGTDLEATVSFDVADGAFVYAQIWSLVNGDWISALPIEYVAE